MGGVFPIHWFGHCCCRMYRLATIFAQTDDIMMTTADHTVWQYDRLTKQVNSRNYALVF